MCLNVLNACAYKTQFCSAFLKHSLTLLYEIGLSDDCFCFTSFLNIPLKD